MIKVKIVQELDVDPRAVATVAAQFLEWLDDKGVSMEPSEITSPAAFKDSSYTAWAAMFAAEVDGQTL